MSDGEESEYELNTLCEKITTVLTEQEWYSKNRSVSKVRVINNSVDKKL